MRIMLIITGLRVGGAERLVVALADQFVARNHEVMLVCLQGETEILPSNPYVQVVKLDMKRSVFGAFKALKTLRSLIFKFKPHVVNSHLAHANLVARILRLITPIPRLISSAHNMSECSWVRILGYRLTDRLADISTNVSERAVGAFEDEGAVKPGRMVAIHNGIDTEIFSFLSSQRAKIRKELCVGNEAQLLLAVGRLIPEKDYYNLLDAFALLLDGLFDTRLAIIGEGPLREQLIEYTQRLGIVDRVDFLGLRHDVPAVLNACDIFVLSSAREGFGLVVAEAMSCERIVVATDSGGVREVVDDAGFLVPPEQSGKLARALNNAMSLSVEEKRRLGRLARMRVVEHFSLAGTAARYLEVYNDQV